MWAGPVASSGYPSAEWRPLGGSPPVSQLAVSASASMRRRLGIPVKLGPSDPALQGQGTRMRRRGWAKGSQSPGGARRDFATVKEP